MIASSDRRPSRRVLVVDDSAFMRRLVSELVAATGEFTVVGTASDGADAIRQVHTLDPDIVTLDIAMPEPDGLSVLDYIMRETPRAVVMLSAGTATAASAGLGARAGAPGGREPAWATMRALELGAVDFVQKPSGPISLDVAQVGDRLLSALRAAEAVDVGCLRRLACPGRADRAGRARPSADGDRAAMAAASARTPAMRAATPPLADAVVVIAASTGGPAALAQLVPRFRAPLGAAVIVVQHLPEGFSSRLAARLDGLSPLPVREAEDGMRLHADTIYLAPGGRHTRIVRDAHGATLVFSLEPPVWGVRPAADPLLTSAAASFGARAVGVVLTGMGRDGADGARRLRRAGGTVLVQEPSEAVVSGMPTAALRQAGADAILSLDDAADQIARAVRALPSAPAVTDPCP